MKELKSKTLATYPKVKETPQPGKAPNKAPYYQTGGGNLMSLFNWFAQNVPDDNFNSAEDVAKEFQQLSPEEQQAFVQNIQQQMQGDEPEMFDNPQEEAQEMQYGGVQFMPATPTKKYQFGGLSKLGYSDSSPYKDLDYIPIQSNHLTMENTGKHLMGVGNQSGKVQYMKPYSGDYYFPEDETVTEYPLAQTGKFVKKKQENLSDKNIRDMKELAGNIIQRNDFLRNKLSKTDYEKNKYFTDKELFEYEKEFNRYNPLIQALKRNKTTPEIKKTPEINTNITQYSGSNIPQVQAPVTQVPVTTDQYSDNIVDKPKPKLKFNKQNTQTQIPESTYTFPYQDFYNTQGYKYDNLNKTSFNQKAPDEFTEFDNQVDLMNSKTPYNFSDANIAQKTAMKFGKTINNISSLDPKLIERDKEGNIVDQTEDWQKVLDIDTDSPFEYLPMLQGYTNAMYQDPQFRATANVRGAKTPEIDIRGSIQAIDNELKDSMRNVNLNSTAGQAIAAQLQANASKNKLNIINEAAVKNAQLRGQNDLSEANRMNQQSQLQNQYDAQYYDNILRSKSVSQEEKQKAINALLSRKDQKTAFKTNLALATMPYNNFQIKDDTLLRNMKAKFYAPEVNPKKIEEESTKKKQVGGFGNKFKFKMYS